MLRFCTDVERQNVIFNRNFGSPVTFLMAKKLWPEGTILKHTQMIGTCEPIVHGTVLYYLLAYPELLVLSGSTGSPPGYTLQSIPVLETYTMNTSEIVKKQRGGGREREREREKERE